MSYVKNDIVERTVVKLTAEGGGVGKTNKKQVGRLVDAVLESIRELIIECSTHGSRLELRRFGTFEVRKMKPRRIARNPRFPNKEFFVPARCKVHFRPCGNLRQTVDKQEQSE